MNDRVGLEKLFWFVMGLTVTSLLSLVTTELMLWSLLLSVVALLLISWRLITIRKPTQQRFTPKSKHYKQIQKIEKKRQKSDQLKYNTISDQIKYIESKWGYSKTQQKVIDDFLDKEAYKDIYNRLNASLLPQLITMIDQCLTQEQKGCKRAVSRRIKEVTLLMKSELRKQKLQHKEKLETTIEVYDHLLSESR